MPTGLLKIKGLLDINQFWNNGSSDADTVKVQVDEANGAFTFSKNGKTSFKVTHVFAGAQIQSSGLYPAIDDKGRIDVRLQGVDAPELHYRSKSEDPTNTKFNELKLTADYRQTLGESATVNLAKLLLDAFGNKIIDCFVVTFVDTPNDVFDMFGRLIGDILVTINGKEVNLNHWLAENGWGMPAFYTSMNKDEMSVIEKLGTDARKNKKGIWKFYSENLTSFDFNRKLRSKGSVFDAKADEGAVNYPKIFRRQVNYECNQKAGIFTGSFVSFLAKKKDVCYLKKDFLQFGEDKSHKTTLDKLFDKKNKLLFAPEEIIFAEKPSKIKVAAGKKAIW